VYVNPQFCLTTGYSLEEVRRQNKNCSFLQGPDTPPATVQTLSRAIAAGQSVHTEILNYTKGGRPFVNYLTLKPVFEPAPRLGADGSVQWRMAFFLGMQYEVIAADSPSKVLELEALLQSLPSEVD
jgi:PAS domain-containing protein